jgi:branched-chain amino acid aminotransferase
MFDESALPRPPSGAAQAPLPAGERPIWLDGALVPFGAAHSHVLTHSLHYGLAVFEGVRTYATPRGPALFRVREHTERLRASAHVCGMPLPFSDADLLLAQREVVYASRAPSAYVRTIAFYGAEALGLDTRRSKVHVASAALDWGAYLGPHAHSRGIRVRTASFVRPAPSAAVPRAKVSAGYALSILARREAIESGHDEALLLDASGAVAEGSSENLFIVAGDRLIEPSSDAALRGITRDSVRQLARDLGYEVVSERLLRDDVYLAREAFFCGTAAEITPIVELDGRRIGAGAPGPVTERLMAAFRAATSGEDPRYAHWLTPV